MVPGRHHPPRFIPPRLRSLHASALPTVSLIPQVTLGSIARRVGLCVSLAENFLFNTSSPGASSRAILPTPGLVRIPNSIFVSQAKPHYRRRHWESGEERLTDFYEFIL